MMAPLPAGPGSAAAGHKAPPTRQGDTVQCPCRLPPGTAGRAAEEESVAGVLAVLGAGAIGGVIGGRATAAGTDIWLLDGWVEHIQTMRDQGLVLDGARGEVRTRVQALHFDELDRLPGPIEIGVVAVKSYDTEAVVERVRPYLAADATLVSVQNGLNEEIIARLIGAERTLGAVTRLSAALVGPGQVRETRQPVPFGLGELDGHLTDRLRRVASLLAPAAECELTDNIWGKLWSKLMLNCTLNPTCGISGLTAGRIWEHPVARDLLFRVCREGVDVGHALGVRFEPAGGMDMELLATRDPALRLRAEEQVSGYAKVSQEVRPSMLQDLQKGRRTEIDYLNGHVVAKARELGRPAPVNAGLLEMVREIEAGQRGIAITNVDELAHRVGRALPAESR